MIWKNPNLGYIYRNAIFRLNNKDILKDGIYLYTVKHNVGFIQVQVYGFGVFHYEIPSRDMTWDERFKVQSTNNRRLNFLSFFLLEQKKIGMMQSLKRIANTYSLLFQGY